MDVEENFDGGM